MGFVQEAKGESVAVDEALRKAAELIDRGWCQQVPRTPDGKICAGTAIHDVGGDNIPLVREMYARVCVAAQLSQGEILSIWNDRTHQTQAAVSATFRRAAEKAFGCRV